MHYFISSPFNSLHSFLYADAAFVRGENVREPWIFISLTEEIEWSLQTGDMYRATAHTLFNHIHAIWYVHIERSFSIDRIDKPAITSIIICISATVPAAGTTAAIENALRATWIISRQQHASSQQHRCAIDHLGQYTPQQCGQIVHATARSAIHKGNKGWPYMPNMCIRVVCVCVYVRACAWVGVVIVKHRIVYRWCKYWRKFRKSVHPRRPNKSTKWWKCWSVKVFIVRKWNICEQTIR